MLKFFYNGIKDNGGKLQPAWYDKGNLISYCSETISISAKEYSGFSKGVHEAFEVQNDTDSQTDYFDKDRIRVQPSHPLYAQVYAAWKASTEKREARWQAREQRVKDKHAARTPKPVQPRVSVADAVRALIARADADRRLVEMQPATSSVQ